MIIQASSLYTKEELITFIRFFGVDIRNAMEVEIAKITNFESEKKFIITLQLTMNVKIINFSYYSDHCGSGRTIFQGR